ncbi:MAG TPA: ribosome-associated translation inhibitor RaiA [Rubricoccaceae bacterium]|nr:ribosome-associated translation inhibitor RaiA [Rubricoccaceae bacterium]
MIVSLKGTRLTLTSGIRRLVEDKLADAFRAFGDTDLAPVTVEVEVEHTTRRYRDLASARPYRAEATVHVPGATLRAEGSADDLEQAIVEMKHTLTRQIREWRAQRREASRQGARAATGP